MKVGKPYFEIEDRIDGMEILKKNRKSRANLLQIGRADHR